MMVALSLMFMLSAGLSNCMHNHRVLMNKAHEKTGKMSRQKSREERPLFKYVRNKNKMLGKDDQVEEVVIEPRTSQVCAPIVSTRKSVSLRSPGLMTPSLLLGLTCFLVMSGQQVGGKIVDRSEETFPRWSGIEIGISDEDNGYGPCREACKVKNSLDCELCYDAEIARAHADWEAEIESEKAKKQGKKVIQGSDVSNRFTMNTYGVDLNDKEVKKYIGAGCTASKIPWGVKIECKFE